MKSKLKVPYNKDPGIYHNLWRVARAEPAVDLMEKYIKLKNKKVLDVGCGEGPISLLAAGRKAYVEAIDPTKEYLYGSKTLYGAKKLCKSPRVNFHLAVGENIPFKDKTFDAAFSFDSMEHVQDIDKTMFEIRRTLKKNGYVYVEFTPYLSLIAGDHLYDFTIWPVQYLPKKLMKKYIMSKKATGRDDPKQAWYLYEQLNHLTIKKFWQICKKHNFEILEQKFMLVKFSLPFLKYLGFLREAIPTSYIAVLKKV